jgi:dienelactone hydrolase
MAARHWFFEDEGFEFLTLIALGGAPYRVAEAGEVLAAVAAIEDGDAESWLAAWLAAGARAEAVAEAAAAKGHDQAARDAHLRAAMYIGTGFFYILGTGRADETLPVWRRHRANAEAAFRLWPTPVEKVAIPYQDTTLEGYFFSGGDGERPLYIANNGSDGTVVEMLTFGLDEAVRRGWHALTFDGPGQGQALYEQGLYFRHDWERVITPVVDWALARGGVDPDRIALFGCSQAGYWVPRAAAFEHRLAAIVADPGVVKANTSWLAQFPEPLLALYRAGDRAAFDAAIEGAADDDPAMLATGLKRMEPFGTDSVYDILAELEQWDLTEVARDIRCPTLITDPEDEQFWPGQPRQLYDLVTAPKTLMPFTAAEGANWHCEPMAPVLRSHRVLDWLEQTLGRA